MPACIIHGKRLSRRTVRLPDGSEEQDLAADGGDWADASYSTVARVIEHCASLGLSEHDWPVFYDRNPGDTDLDEISRRCERLRPLIVGLPDDECATASWLLAKIRTWLADGEVFAVFE
jgi:hypothetical protein